VVVASTIDWSWPDSVVEEPASAGTALGRMAFEAPLGGKFLPESMDRYIEDYERRSHCVSPRDFHRDRPARTLTCRMKPPRRSRVAMAMLAVAGLKPGDPWGDASSYLEDRSSQTPSQREIPRFWNTHYGTNLKDSSYDDLKRQALIHLEAVHIVMSGARNPDAATNDGTRGHAQTREGLA